MRTTPSKPQHVCQQPTIAGLTVPQQPDWTCAKCGRIWRDSIAGAIRWWAEVRGPTHYPRGESL